MRGDPGARFTGREIGLLILGALTLAIITSWPLVAHLPSRIEPDLGDPIRTAWQIAVEGHTLAHHPLHLFQTNAFYGHPNSLTFSDSLLGYSPAGLIGSGTTATLVRYNLLFLFAWTLPLVGVYLLARELGLGAGAAAVAGAAFTYAPFKAAEAGHLHVLSGGAIPLAFFLLIRGYRRGSGRTVLAGWVVATWQLSLGFTLALPFSYTLAVLVLITIALWWRRGRARLPERVIVASAIGIVLFAAMAAFEGLPYLRTSKAYTAATRPIAEIKTYSSTPKSFLAAPLENRVWGKATQPIRYTISSQNESVFFPGLTIVVLVIIGLGASVYAPRLRWGLLAGALIFAVLALGLDLTGAGYPYRLLYDYAPGWNGVRVPGRIYTMTALGLALLAGAGAHRLVLGAGRRWGGRLGGAGRTGSVLAAALGALVVFEGAGREGHPVVPAAPPSTASIHGPQLYLPSDTSTDRLFQFWSTNGFPTIANGVSTFDIKALDDLRGGMADFPDAPGVRKLQGLGIRTVVLDPQVAALKLPPSHGSALLPSDSAAAARRSVAGLPVKVRRDGPLVIFTIEGERR